MKLAIADPPYLGRAALWYGGNERRADHHTPGRSRGRAKTAPEYHPDAHRWDDPMEHIALMSHMNAEYDGWAMAASGKTLAHHYSASPSISGRGWRPRNCWQQPICANPGNLSSWPGWGWMPSPAPWTKCMAVLTRWVLDMLGYQPGDEVDDLFPGSGAVQRAVEVLL